MNELLIVGSGIVGLAHAVYALEAGWRVTVIERTGRPLGASVRNFGTLWPIGQELGENRARALRSLRKWRQLSEAAHFWLHPCGSLNLAYTEAGWAVLREFQASPSASGQEFELLDAAGVAQRYPAAQTEHLQGALFSASEISMEPRASSAALVRYLENQGVRFRFGLTATRVHDNALEVAGGETIAFDRLVICSGHELRLLYPTELARENVVPCKLQMMRTASQPDGWKLGPIMVGDLTLRHYPAFGDCPSLPRLKEQLDAQCPGFEGRGIHVIAAQHSDGTLVLGDSHEYASDFAPDLHMATDEMVLRYLTSFVQVPNLAIADRWAGFYLKCRDARTQVILEPQERVQVVTGLGGHGMTMSFAVAEEVVGAWQQEAPETLKSAAINLSNADNTGNTGLGAVIFDWAGTIIDWGCCAPVEALCEAFAAYGVTVDEPTVRAPMGAHKRDHIVEIFNAPNIRAAWEKEHGTAPDEASVERVYALFTARLAEALPLHAVLIPGTVELMAQLRAHNVRVGSTTGYMRAMLSVLTDSAADQGFIPDATVCADEVSQGRPAPWACWRILEEFKVFPSQAVKIGDTIADVEEGRNAGMLVIAVAASGNETGLSRADWYALKDADRLARVETARRKLRAAGADWVVDSVADVWPILQRLL